MKEKYKSFRKQFTECHKNGNLIEVDGSVLKEVCGSKLLDKLLVCTKYKSICHSGVCREERI